MVQVASNLLSVMPARSTGRLSAALANQSTGRGFDQVLEKSSSISSSPKKSEVKKSDKSKDDKSEQTADTKAKKSSDPVEEKKPHEDSQDATDTALAASAVQVDQSVESEKLLAANATQNASAANPTANVTNSLIESTSQSSEQGGAEDQSSKQRNAAEAMLRLLGVATGQGASPALALVDAGASNAVLNVNAPTPAGPALPMSAQDDGTMDQANLARVSRALQNAVQQKGGTITIRMMPPELGQVRVDIQLHGGKVSASFQTEHQSVGSLMSRELSQLRQALEKQGFTVDKLEVSQRPASSNASNSSQNGSQHQAPSDGRSRGQYMPQSPSSDENQFENNSLENSFETQLDQQSQTL